VRDTQVGLKVLSRGVADDVVPLLLVKRFAFDLELLAVAHALGHGRIRELPIRLDYRFTGSGVRSLAVARALWDTAAVFYRLRVLRTYQRKQSALGRGRTSLDYRPSVSLVGDDGDLGGLQDYPVAERVDQLGQAAGEIVAILEAGDRPAGNWLSAAVPFFQDVGVVAVVCPRLAPLDCPLRERVSAAVLESRLGGGSRRERYLPGNLRTVKDFPGGTIVVRRDALAGVQSDTSADLVRALSRLGRVVYTPETVVVSRPPPALGPLLSTVRREGVRRGTAVREGHVGELGLTSSIALVPVAAVAAVPAIVLGGQTARAAGAIILGSYAVAVASSSLLGALRFRSLSVGILTVPAIVASQFTHLIGFVRGL
jgi:hypothetical protein